MKKSISYLLFPLFTFLIFSCNATKFVPEDEYLLHDYRIDAGQGDYNKRELDDFIKQKPNKRILFWKFYLSLYNLSNPEKENWFHNWLRRIGEPPVIYDEVLKNRSSEQLSLYMRNRGFYDAEVSDTAIFQRKRAEVEYRVIPNTPYTIRDINYFFQDASLSGLVLADTTSSLVKRDDPFDVEVLQEERERIESLLRNQGYYNFSRDFIYYDADSSLDSYQVDLTLVIRNFPGQDNSGRLIRTTHPVYRIRDVYMVTDFNAMAGDTPSSRQKDTLAYDSVFVVFGDHPNIRPSMVTQKNYIIPGSLFDASDVARTYRNLSSLSAFQMVDIRFNELDGGNERMLDCEVLIVPAVRQSYALKVEGTNSGGNIGAAANLSYQHRNLFRGSERFDLSFRGAIETLSESSTASDTVSGSLGLMQEFGVEARLRFPVFLLPFRTDQFIRKYNPQTNIRLSYNFQKRPDFIRTIANASFGYEWMQTPNLTHRVFPVEASLILTPFKSQEFQDWLEGKYLFYSYEPHLIVDTRYSMIWSNQKVLKNQSFQAIRFNVETAGNLLYTGFRLLGPDQGDEKYQLLGVNFAQYLRADIDFRSYTYLYEDISLVLRGFAGAGYAYLNSTAMPFEKQYFSGGANSIRGWQVKNLGPGSFRDPEDTPYPNQTGDVKLEANMEYRFKLFWKLESALFLDVGNIWSLSPEDDRPGAGFEFNSFYRELAVGTGVGARMVFSFFIFRFDLGIPLRSPYTIGGSHWLPGNSGISGRDLTYNIAIGYPF